MGLGSSWEDHCEGRKQTFRVIRLARFVQIAPAQADSVYGFASSLFPAQYHRATEL